MDEARKGQIAVLIITEQVRRKGIFRHETILHEIGDDTAARLNLSTSEMAEFIQEILQDAAEGANITS